MFEKLNQINSKPQVFEFYTASTLWDDEHRSEQMLAFHLNENVDVSSRNGKFINDSVEWMTSKFNLGENKSVCDFGCGPGLYTMRFAAKGCDVTGIDFSKKSIQYAQNTARKKNLGIDYHLMNYLDFQSDKKFDLITMIMCDFCALSPDQVQRLFNVFAKHLKEDGCILFDVYSETAYNQREEASLYEFNQLNGFWQPHDYYGFVNTFKYDDAKVVLDKYTIIDETSDFTVYNWLQYYTPDSLKTVLNRAGFDIVELFANIASEPYDEQKNEFAVIVKKIK